MISMYLGLSNHGLATGQHDLFDQLSMLGQTQVGQNIYQRGS
jgi:hypothetical protein